MDDERVWQFRRSDGGSFHRYTLRDLSDKVLRQYTSTGDFWVVDEDYVYRNGLLLSAETPAGKRHFRLDHLGSPRLITDAGGSRVAFHAYYPFGEEATDAFQDQERMKFTGHERDLADPGGTGDDLDYMHARHCSPLTGRFLTVDPGTESFRPEAPQTWNRYSYVLNNPLRFFDPDGRLSQLVYGTYSEGNIFGHIAISVDGQVFSFGTASVSESGDWGVALEAYLSEQNEKRSTVLITLEISSEQEAELLGFLASNRPNPDQYDEIKYSCVTVCENALESQGIIPNLPGPVAIDRAGNELQAGTPSSFTPRGLVSQVRNQGLVKSERTVGRSKVSRLRSFVNSVKRVVDRFR